MTFATCLHFFLRTPPSSDSNKTISNRDSPETLISGKFLLFYSSSTYVSEKICWHWRFCSRKNKWMTFWVTLSKQDESLWSFNKRNRDQYLKRVRKYYICILHLYITSVLLLNSSGSKHQNETKMSRNKENLKFQKKCHFKKCFKTNCNWTGLDSWISKN